MKQPLTVCIVGTGLIGTSLSLALRKHKSAYITVGYDRSPDHAREAYEAFDTIASSLQESVSQADIVVLATPVSVMGQIAKSINPHLASHAIVTDVGSVKEAVVKDVSAFIDRNVFIGGHPLAGTEHSGAKHAFATMFRGAVCLLTPHADHRLETIECIAKMWEVCGAKVKTLDIQEHDKILCVVSHLPHIITYATTLSALTSKGVSLEKIQQYSATGFQDFTRLACSDPLMWRDIFLANQGNLLPQIEHIQDILETFKDLIKKKDGNTLMSKITQPRAFCQRINKRFPSP